ncbi:MAG TPA: peptidoglycan-binding domain-containing protein [Rhodothermales bacterium]|nr:peptidoglycan-binding domain-containing protein [Rhodothermales bacterium]
MLVKTGIAPGHRNRLKTATIQVVFRRYPGTDAAGGIGNLPYRLLVDGSVVASGVTPADGILRLSFSSTKQASLEILGSVYHLRIRRSIEGITTVHGQQRRLNSLGYFVGGVDGDVGPHTDDGILQFQADHDPLDPDGIVGSKTRNQLHTAAGF